MCNMRRARSDEREPYADAEEAAVHERDEHETGT
jgi:hypothetical protein